ncbi:MAG: cold shock and DUF1294 domain-containing protein [Candidatus Hydrogenedentes bacterium]|nr:cold shock and DUF1294 domain-containing protein [Candidatus Hydrogenedentota bacterium]
MRLEGTITTWKDDQGYGFITPDNGGPQIFVHIKAFPDSLIRPRPGDPVPFELGEDDRGRPRATRVRRERFAVQTPAASISAPLLLLAAIALTIVGLLTVAGQLPLVILDVYLIASGITFLAYWQDKAAARKNQWRTAERTLHLLGIVGGWPGALIAQQVFRHKSSKTSFQLVFWLTVFANIGVLAWFLTPHGAVALRDVMQSMANS